MYNCDLPPFMQGKAPDLEWFPRLRCMSLLNPEEAEQEQYEMRDLQQQLLDTTMLVKNLSIQLTELKERVRTYIVIYVIVIYVPTCMS